MSLYCFGKLLPPVDVEGLLAGFDCRVSLPESDDIAVLENEPSLVGEGSFFLICDSEGGPDATRLWNEATEGEVELEGIIQRILDAPDVEIGSIAFVDGGIEDVIEGSKSECLERIRKLLSRPWDTIGNPLFVWKN